MTQTQSKSIFRYWNIDKWAFILFIALTLGVTLYFAQLSKQWQSPIFDEIALEPNAPPITLNYSEELDMLVLDKPNGTSINISCLTVEEDLCGRGQPYAYKYEVEYANIAQIGDERFIDQITYIVNKTNVVDLKTSIRSHAETKLKNYDKQRTLFIGLVGIVYLFYIAIRLLGFNSKKRDND